MYPNWKTHYQHNEPLPLPPPPRWRLILNEEASNEEVSNTDDPNESFIKINDSYDPGNAEDMGAKYD
jgi:hypothetical protein